MEETREKIELFRNYYFVCFRSFEQDNMSPTYLEPLNMYIIVFREGILSVRPIYFNLCFFPVDPLLTSSFIICIYAVRFRISHLAYPFFSFDHSSTSDQQPTLKTSAVALNNSKITSASPLTGSLMPSLMISLMHSDL